MARKRKPNKHLTNVLQAAVDHAERMVQEDHSMSSKLVTSANRVGNKIMFANGLVIKTRSENWMGKKKNFYDVYNTNTGSNEAEGLGLFMSAMAIVKLNSKKRTSRTMDSMLVVRADSRYQHHLNDAAMFGMKLQSNKTDGFKRDLYQIRMDEAMLNCQSAKKELRSFV